MAQRPTLHVFTLAYGITTFQFGNNAQEETIDVFLEGVRCLLSGSSLPLLCPNIDLIASSKVVEVRCTRGVLTHFTLWLACSATTERLVCMAIWQSANDREIIRLMSTVLFWG